MWKLNRQTRYTIIKELINIASPEVLEELIVTYGFKCFQISDDVEVRRKELLDYLEEMNKCWNENYIDLTDRQYIKIIEIDDNHKKR